jgi:hypothetical protein
MRERVWDWALGCPWWVFKQLEMQGSPPVPYTSISHCLPKFFAENFKRTIIINAVEMLL